jgi:hypothetical protein
MYAHSITVWDILKIIRNYCSGPTHSLGLNHLNDWKETNLVFRHDRISLRSGDTSSVSYFDVYIARLFPAEDQLDIPQYCSDLLSKKTLKRNLISHVAYIYIMANLIEAKINDLAALFNETVKYSFLTIILVTGNAIF